MRFTTLEMFVRHAALTNLKSRGNKKGVQQSKLGTSFTSCKVLLMQQAYASTVLCL